MAFRSETGEAVDYYFIYGPGTNRVIAQYGIHGAAVAARWHTVFGSAVNATQPAHDS